MKNTTYLFVLMLSLVLMINSCSKNENSPNPDVTNGTRLRITSMADNIGMQYETTFTYNDKGLLTKISEGTSLLDIKYDTKNNPTKIIYSGSNNFLWEYTIDWVNNGFNVTEVNPKDTRYTYISNYELNNKNQTIKVTVHANNDNSDYIKNYQWRGDSLIVSYPPTSHFDFYHKYIKKNSPFSGINIAIIAMFPDIFSFVFNEECQNTYCTTDEYIFISSTELEHRSINYTFNSQDYPTRAEAFDPEDFSGKRKVYKYYEYESY